MDKYQAIDEFWNRFSIPAYDESSVPDNAELPYITYSAQTSDLVSGPVAMTASLWYYGQSWAAVSKKAIAISEYIGMGGIVSLYDGGALWIKRGSQFSQRLSDPDDPLIRRIILNIEAEYISAN